MMSVFKFVAVLTKDDEISECLSWIAKDFKSIRWDYERSFMLESIKSSRLYITICGICMYGSWLSYTVIFTLVQEPEIIGNVTHRQLCFPSYFVFFNPHVRDAS